VNLGGMKTCFVNSLKIKYICRTYGQQTDPKLYRQNIKLKCCFFVLIATRCRQNRAASFGNDVWTS